LLVPTLLFLPRTTPRRSGRPESEQMRFILRKTRVQARIDGLRTDIWPEDNYSDGETCVGRIVPPDRRAILARG